MKDFDFLCDLTVLSYTLTRAEQKQIGLNSLEKNELDQNQGYDPQCKTPRTIYSGGRGITGSTQLSYTLCVWAQWFSASTGSTKQRLSLAPWRISGCLSQHSWVYTQSFLSVCTNFTQKSPKNPALQALSKKKLQSCCRKKKSVRTAWENNRVTV